MSGLWQIVCALAQPYYNLDVTLFVAAISAGLISPTTIGPWPIADDLLVYTLAHPHQLSSPLIVIDLPTL